VIRKRKKYDTIVLASHVVAIPFLFLVRIFPFINAGENIIVMSFFLHGLGDKKFIQKILRFLFGSKGILLIAQSDYEIEFYSQLMDKSKVVHFPFCRYEVSVSEDCGKGEEYIFAGGYTNRDYECLFKAARQVHHNFTIICSRLNQRESVNQNPENVKVLRDTSQSDFNGYLKNSKIVVIPLKEKTGSSGQMVALAAMMFKKPVIYTNIDSVSQYFENGISGIPYEINNAEDLAEKIRCLLSAPQLCEQLGDKAYKTYYEKYHISKYCEFFADLITK
jgi:glycosyltransferase involved in cell wall biosynthesis